VIWHIPFIRIWVQLLTIPFHLLYPAVIVMICMGVYSIHSSATDVLLLLVFGGLGYGMRLLGFQPAPLLVGLVLGPLMEEHLRRSLIVSRGDLIVFFERPISVAVLTVSFLVLVLTFRKKNLPS
jgi:TctA family transporter